MTQRQKDPLGSEEPAFARHQVEEAAQGEPDNRVSQGPASQSDSTGQLGNPTEEELSL